MPPRKKEEERPPMFSPSEVKKHATVSDAWMTLRNRVYDVSDWHDHPGGSVIFTHAGDDITDAFNLFHPPSARRALDSFCIGTLEPVLDRTLTKEAKDQRAFEQAYRDLRSKMIAAGLFKLNYGFYAYKFASQAVLLVGAVLCSQRPGALSFVVGAVLLALFWQQAGWLAHDVCHNQLCQMKTGHAASWWNRGLGLVTGNLFQGFSVKWWKDKHNRHHAVPNVQGSGDFINGDPDVDTMPLLAWSMQMAKLAKDDPSGRWWIQMQRYTYLPLLCFARLVWLQSSIEFVWGVKLAAGMFSNDLASDSLARVQLAGLKGVQRLLEQSFLIIHHAWVAVLCYQRPTLLSAVGFWLLAQAIGSLLVFVVTGNGHNGMATYEAASRPDYWTLQVTTTRNISGGAFMHWLCGGLEYQVDHHLFPMMPRHSLPRAHEIIVAFCKEHGLKYAEASLYHGVKDVIKHLESVSHEFLDEFPGI